ncbi:MAG TPA: cellulose synthase subunit BcsC-related outer membrane protein [Acidobacteriaceae bacterium]|nr:cellulose synthase subunit BcsC-related outer membrane protein [Acidobacteriaceae bacterium]
MPRREEQRTVRKAGAGAAVRVFWLSLCAPLFLSLGTISIHAQAQKESDAEKVLIDKAKALEARGRPDIAVQVWQQILLSDPSNQMALAGEARDYRLSGNSAASDAALDKLRKINPADPNIGRIQGLTSNKARDSRLAQAGALAKAGNPEAAMRIYREYYGDHPPDGDMALAYYETLYATPNGKTEALNAMRAAAARNPGDSRFIVTLGRMLTYDARTRAEGIKILREHLGSSDAQNSLRQALIWDSANPASAAELKEYLKTHPADTELQGRLKVNEGKLAEMNAGIARTPAERAAFAALNAHRLAEAETRFQALLDRNEKDARAAAGMGFLRMQQNNFGAAISYLEQSEQNGFRDRSVVEALATSRFWFTMGEASAAFDANQLDVSVQKYQAALAMRPRSAEALNGLAGAYTKDQQYPQAAAIYQQILKSQPNSLDAWRGLFLSYARNNQNQQAIALMGRFPASVKFNLNRDPDFLRTLAAIYQANGRDADAQRVLAQALALPFPDNGSNLKTGTRLQYASILMAAKRYDQAAEMYQQIVNDDSSNLPAWMGLVTAQHQMQHEAAAIDVVKKMPPDVYESALADSGFLALLGSIYQQSSQLEIAQGLLERSVRLQTKSGGQPSIDLQVQLAGIYLQRGDTAKAYDLYKQVLSSHPENLDAWRGLIGTLQQTNRTSEALEEMKLIPPAVRQQLENDVQFEQTEASLYASAGDTANATTLFNRVQRHYQSEHEVPPADVEIQSAYLLYNTKNDRALYPALMRLGARQDLTNAQRETIQGLWANWSVRRAAAAFQNGNNARAVDILDAAAQAFPDNLTVRKAVAGGYLTVGRTKDSLALFKQIDLQDGSTSDFQGAIGAALAANDKAQAEQWLRQALDRYPHDPGVLGLAARFEQARGDNARAAEYWRASLAAMPEVTPTDKLAHELVHPEQPNSSNRPATPDDLARMLNPDQDAAGASGRATKPQLPPLPSYGRDPYDPGAPVVIAPQQGTAPGTMPVYPVPTTTNQPLPPSELNPSTSPAGSKAIPSPVAGTAPDADSMKSPGSKSGASRKATRRKDATSYSGHMNLPAADDTVTSTGAAPNRNQSAPSQPTYAQPSNKPRPSQPQPAPVYPQLIPQSFRQPAPQQRITLNPPQASVNQSQGQLSTGLRLSSQPMNPVAARAQALLTDETDGQITQGLATGTIRYLPNSTNAAQPLAYSNVQYTPSAQDAAAGAYSAQKPATPVQAQPQIPIPPPPASAPESATPVKPSSAKPSPRKAKSARKHAKSKPAPAAPEVPTLVTAPGEQPAPAAQPAVSADPVSAGPVSTGSDQGVQSTTGITDQQLQDRNLPPLRGRWARLTRKEPEQVNPREEAELQLRTIEGGYSAWLGGTGNIAHRTGDPGYSNLSSLSADFEASLPLGTAARLTVIARPVFLDSGQANGNAVINLTTGQVTASSPEPIGTLPGATAAITPPAQQNASGIAGEVQLALGGNFAIAGGYNPYGFLISNWTGRASWRPGRGPFTFLFNRDSVKDTQLSYSGLRDPATITAFNPGNVWGGVMANSGNVQFARGDLTSGFYLGAGGQYITGYHVQQNRRYDGSAGAYWRILAMPEYGSLNIGANFFAMHYTYNLQAFTYGQGGYFSPQSYFLANVPITWTGHYLTRWHYTVLGSFGIQAFSEDAEPLDPLDIGIETNTFDSAKTAALTSVGPNYDLRAQVAYAIHDHWFVGGFAGANNSRNYTNVNAGFSVRYLFRSQPSTVAGPTGLFQTDDQHQLRPLTVP